MKNSKKALLMVDLQNDFCAGGNLAVPGGDEVIPLANRLQSAFEVVVATQDWHPREHMSFAATHSREVGEVIEVDGLQQVLWPVHCVQETRGAQFHPALATERVRHIVHKGVDKKIDSYSAFYDNAHRRATGLEDYLRSQQIEEIYIMGLATDYCVKYSALDAVQLGFKVYLIVDACRGVELNAGDIDHAMAEMLAAGVKIITSTDIVSANQ